MPSTGGRRRRHGGHDAHLLIILCIFAAVFGVAIAGGGSPSLDPSSSSLIKLNLRGSLWTNYHWSRGDFGSDEGGEASGPSAWEKRRRPGITPTLPDVTSYCMSVCAAYAYVRAFLPSYSQGLWLAWLIWKGGRPPELQDAKNLVSLITERLVEIVELAAPSAHYYWIKTAAMAVIVPLKHATLLALLASMSLPFWGTRLRMLPCHRGEMGDRSPTLR